MSPGPPVSYGSSCSYYGLKHLLILNMRKVPDPHFDYQNNDFCYNAWLSILVIILLHQELVPRYL